MAPRAKTTGPRHPRFDGIYRDAGNRYGHLWLRFYRDGTVLESAMSGCCVEEVATRLRPGSSRSFGRYSTGPGLIAFWLKGKRSTVVADYMGTILADHSLDLVSAWYASRLRTGKGTMERYSMTFFPLSRKELDGKVDARRFRQLTSVKELSEMGLSPREVAAVKQNPALPLWRLQSLTADEMVARGGISQATAERIAAWRRGE